ncbi:sugar phosphate isomerase/epimerase [Rubellimicrobium rubrum]|uniref:Sugar phosphate isomerase/epimerase n=1 Tax=Rubellimicrobium rubrum TaxID=2585369 RepID=A0A5C4MXS9_9RHOB|nr:sugar phosphate isomerase/epimerase [Rubellimicrobium rubrum]TNC50428.1 sugar phosphate isomerase/epimerase [Rubellimicrobium rubrum]
MRVGIFAKTFPGETPLAVLSAAQETGYDTVQYNMACSGLGALPLVVPQAELEAVHQAVLATGVTISAVSATYNMIHPDQAVRAAGRNAFSAIAGAARAIGCPVITVCTGSRDPLDQWRHHPDNATTSAWDDAMAEMSLLLPIAERHGLTIGVEPEMANVVSSAARAREMLDVLDHPALGIVLDPANLFETEAGFRGGAVVDEAIALLADRIILAHAKDRRADGGFAAVGSGIIDMARFVARLRQAGFVGALITHGLSADKAPRVAATLRGYLETAA